MKKQRKPDILLITCNSPIKIAPRYFKSTLKMSFTQWINHLKYTPIQYQVINKLNPEENGIYTQIKTV